MSSFEAVDNELKQGRLEEKKAIDAEKKKLDALAETLKTQGGKAEDHAEFNKRTLQLQQRELNLRKKLATDPAAKEEIDKEQAALNKKQNTFLSKIAGGIGGILGNMKDKAIAAGGGLMKILKGTLFAGLFFALAKFFQSPMFGEVVDVITNVILPKLVVVGRFIKDGLVKLFTGITALFEGDFSKAFDELFSVKAVAALAAITALFAPGLLFKGLMGGVKLFTRAIGGTLGFLERQGMEMEADTKKNRGRAKKARKGFFNKIFGGIADLGRNIGSKGTDVVKKTGAQVADKGKGLASKAGNIGKGLLKGARFLPGIGLAVSGIMGVFDGVSAGFKEYNAGGDAGDVAREAAAGVVSGLTFGLVSQETISGAFTTIGDKFKTGFNKMKEDTLAGVDKIKELGASAKEKLQDVTAGLKEKFDSVSEKVKGVFSNVKGKFDELKAKLPSIKDVGGKISSFFGFGSKDKETKEITAPLVQFEKEKTALKERIAILEKQVSSAAMREMEFREKQLKKLNESAIAKAAGGDATSPVNVVAPQAKVTNNTANSNVSTSSSVVQVDPTLQFALS